jgi:hypothetical protein
MNKDEVKQILSKVGKEIGANVPVLFGIAGIESNFNPSAKSKSGTYVGIFQLANGWDGCNGDDRLDLIKSIKCLWNNHSTYKQRWAKTGDTTWSDFYHYGIHQMGFAGFREIYLNKNKLLSEISEARRKNILANKPSSANWNKVSDWWTYFENKFRTNCELSEPYLDNKSPLNIVNNVVDGLGIEIKSLTTSQKVLIAGGGIILISGIFYLIKTKKTLRVDGEPAVGSIFYNTRDGGGHVGFVIKVDGINFESIEGNTTNSAGEWGVWSKKKNLNEKKYQFIHLEDLDTIENNLFAPLQFDFEMILADPRSYISAGIVLTGGFVAWLLYKKYKK